MSISTMVVLAGYAATVFAAMSRSRTFGVFAGVILSLPVMIGLRLAPHLGLLGEAMPGLMGLMFLHFGSLVVRPRMRPTWFRVLVNWPGLWFASAAMLAWPWAIVSLFGVPPYGAWIPFALAGFGFAQSLHAKEEVVDLRLDPERDAGELARWKDGKQSVPPGVRPLKIVQITDPHLGPFMSVQRLQRICRRAIEREPDLILITGDLMTMESHDLDTVARALQPLAAFEGRVFACHGNHDHEAREVVRRAYARTGVELLVDESVVVETEAGPVQIVGHDFRWRDRQARLAQTCAANPRVPGATRIALLHDPGAFKHLPPGDSDLVLSGHTHGGQVGLLSLGLSGTFLSLVSSIPDHGPWARGRDRLYVHRAQGHYGFPIRLGVPPENSLLRVWRADDAVEVPR